MRAFIAIDLPTGFQAAIERQQAVFRAVSPQARWARSGGIHLTLKFLGEISDPQVAQVREALAAIPPFEKFPVELKGNGFFPNARRPRVFWVGLQAPAALGELAHRVEDALANLGFAREQRDFTPHLTLARFNEPCPQPALQAAAEKQANQSLGWFEVSEYFLFESKLSPQGAKYRKIAAFPAADGS